MDLPIGLPLELFFQNRMVINGPPATVQLPTSWQGKDEATKKPIFNAKIRILSVTSSEELPTVLKNCILLLSVDELPPISLLFSNALHCEYLTASVLTSIQIYQKSAADSLKIRLFNSGSFPLWPNRAVTNFKIFTKLFLHGESET